MYCREYLRIEQNFWNVFIDISLKIQFRITTCIYTRKNNCMISCGVEVFTEVLG